MKTRVAFLGHQEGRVFITLIVEGEPDTLDLPPDIAEEMGLALVGAARQSRSLHEAATAPPREQLYRS